jgi:hypothetical protein
MDFSDISAKSAGELCEKLKHIKLRGGNTQPYLNSFISIETFDPAVLAPTQRYCLISELKKIEQLRWDIMNEFGWDILQLNGYLKVDYSNTTETAIEAGGKPYISKVAEIKTIDILPPVIEEYVDCRGNIKLIINDGQHRCRLAYQMGLPINVAYVRGSNKSYPYYAYPLPNGWADVELREDIPEGYVKKFHVAKDHKALYRNFNSEFENIGDSRPYGDKPKDTGDLSLADLVNNPPSTEELVVGMKESLEKTREGFEKLRDQLSKAGCEAHDKYFSELKLPELKDIDIYDYATTAKIKDLRDRTGEPKIYCREALMKSKGDMEKAVEYLKKRGWGPT